MSAAARGHGFHRARAGSGGRSRAGREHREALQLQVCRGGAQDIDRWHARGPSGVRAPLAHGPGPLQPEFHAHVRAVPEQGGGHRSHDQSHME
eukprot:1020353-Pyramimonas_sp.AAC.1